MPPFLLQENCGMHLSIYNGGCNYFLSCFFKPLWYQKWTINYMKAVLKSIGGNTFDSWASGICLPLRMETTDNNFGIMKRQVCDLKVPFFISTKLLQGGGSNTFFPSTKPMSKASPNTRIFFILCVRSSMHGMKIWKKFLHGSRAYTSWCPCGIPCLPVLYLFSILLIYRRREMGITELAMVSLI